MAAVVEHAGAGEAAGRHHQLHRGGADGGGQRGVAVHLGIDPERLHRRPRRMDIKHVVGRVQHRAQFARAPQLRALLAAVEPFGRPDAVQVVDQLAVFVGVVDVEGVVRLHVGKAHGERADLRAHARIEQMGGRHHAADLVAVRQGVDQHVRTGLARFEAVHVVDAGIALAIGGKVARQDFERRGVGGESGVGHIGDPIPGGCRRGRSGLYTRPGAATSCR